MAYRRSAHEAYWDFCKAVKRTSRFVRAKKVESVLDEILDVAKQAEHQVEIPKGECLWRAQLGYVKLGYCEGGVELDVLEHAYSVERMRPKAEYVGDGRANPSGIAYLYAATDAATAVAEVRPWRGGFVSLSKLDTLGDLVVADLSAHEMVIYRYGGDDNEDQRRCNLWGLVDEDFARPVEPNEQRVDYVPTQIIAEGIRSLGLDGIKYSSSLGPGENFVFFNPGVVEYQEPELCRIDAVDYEFVELPYRSNRHGQLRDNSGS